jgi:hypothetical protein
VSSSLPFLSSKQLVAFCPPTLASILRSTAGRLFAKAFADDRTFYVRYVYLLDCTFQLFCKELMTQGTGNHPIDRAREKGVDDFQETMVKDELKSFLRMGAIPNLTLPSILVSSKGGGLCIGAVVTTSVFSGSAWVSKVIFIACFIMAVRSGKVLGDFIAALEADKETWSNSINLIGALLVNGTQVSTHD